MIARDIQRRLLETANALRLMALECEATGKVAVDRSNDLANLQTYGHRITVLVGGLNACLYQARLHMLTDLAARADVARARRKDLADSMSAPVVIPGQREHQPESQSVV